MSAVPAAVCFGGTVYVYSGSSIDIVGFIDSAPVPHFSFLDISEITANESISEPVADNVSTL